MGEGRGNVFVVKAIKAMLQISIVGRSYSSNDLGPVIVSHKTSKAGIWWEVSRL